jgi:hypothetical protein
MSMLSSKHQKGNALLAIINRPLVWFFIGIAFSESRRLLYRTFGA